MKWKILGTVVALALTCVTALAQDGSQSSPNPVVYNVETATLSELTTEGLQDIASLPAVAEIITPETTLYPWTILLSPDHSRLAFEVYAPDAVTTYYVADVITGDCCVKLDPQDPAMDERGPYGVVFSPDSTQLAVAYKNSIQDSTPEQIVFDVATGAVISRLYAMDVPWPDDVDLPYLFDVTDWTAEGIGVYVADCCDPVTSGQFYRWQPAPLEEGMMYAMPEFLINASNTGPASYAFNIGSESLSTGESIRISRDVNYASAEVEGLYIPQNVVLYQPAEGEVQVIYFNPSNLTIQSAHWVADGQGVLIRHANPDNWQAAGEAYVLWRDSARLLVELDPNDQFLAGTADGWIMQNPETQTVTAFHVSGETVDSRVIGSDLGTLVLVSAPTLGADPQLDPFSATVGSGANAIQGQGLDLAALEPGAIVYRDNTLYNMTVDGATQLMRLTELGSFLGEKVAISLQITPDGSKLLFRSYKFGGDPNINTSSTFYIYDLAAGTCCLPLDIPESSVVGNGVFSADGHQIVVPIISDGVFEQIAIFDLATGASVAQLDGLTITSQLEGITPHVQILTWSDEGVIFQTAYEGPAFLWTPQTNAVTQASQLYSEFEGYEIFTGFLITGDSVKARYDTSFPDVGHEGNYNVIVSLPSDSEPQTIFFDPDIQGIGRPQWVADGQAITFPTYTDEGSSGAVLLRDGTLIPIELMDESDYFSSTRDGWINFNYGTGGYTYYRLNGTEIETIPLIDGAFQELLDTGGFAPVSVPMGLSLGDVPAFQAVTAP